MSLAMWYIYQAAHTVLPVNLSMLIHWGSSLYKWPLSDKNTWHWHGFSLPVFRILIGSWGTVTPVKLRIPYLIYSEELSNKRGGQKLWIKPFFFSFFLPFHISNSFSFVPPSYFLVFLRILSPFCFTYEWFCHRRIKSVRKSVEQRCVDTLERTLDLSQAHRLHRIIPGHNSSPRYLNVSGLLYKLFDENVWQTLHVCCGKKKKLKYKK
jgi:hypothetical protein